MQSHGDRRHEEQRGPSSQGLWRVLSLEVGSVGFPNWSLLSPTPFLCGPGTGEQSHGAWFQLDSPKCFPSSASARHSQAPILQEIFFRHAPHLSPSSFTTHTGLLLCSVLPVFPLHCLERLVFACCFERPLDGSLSVFILSLQPDSKVLEGFYFFSFVSSHSAQDNAQERHFLFVCLSAHQLTPTSP